MVAKCVLVLLALRVFPTKALHAQVVSESTYIATRDSAIRSLTTPNKGQTDAAIKAAHDGALKELERQLRIIIGPFAARGFPPVGHINTTDLSPGDLDFGALDGLNYDTSYKAPSVIVTTRSLVTAWLMDSTRNPKLRKIPIDFTRALETPRFYAFADFNDTGVDEFAQIPVADSARLGVVAAMLVVRAQDVGPWTPTQIIVGVVRGPRVFIATARTAVTIKPAPECLALWKSQVARKGETPYDTYRKCYGEHARLVPEFQRLVDQVKGMVAALPPR